MRHLLNTLFIQTADCYLSLDGENVVILQGEETLGRFPLHNLEAILCFSYKGASPALMGACAERGVSLSFFTSKGRFLAQIRGAQSGNVLLRRKQYRVADDAAQSVEISRNFILGKVANCRQVLLRALRDHGPRLDAEALQLAVGRLKADLPVIAACTDAEQLLGLEGNASACYFALFDMLILRQKEVFTFRGRSRRPPLDEANALLSLTYSLLARDCSAALEAVGLDPYVGFLHRDRPGRASLALDLMEELRPICADRFILTLINERIIRPEHFDRQDNGAVLLTENGRKALFSAWQTRKQEEFQHPFLKEKIAWGLLPYIQALLLARCLRNDLDAYPPCFWR